MSMKTPTGPTIETIMNITLGHVVAKQMRTAQQFGLFRALANGPKTAGQLASEMGVPEQTARILADAMNAIELVDREAGRYSNSEAAGAYLAQDASTEHDLTPLMGLYEDYSYPHWLGWSETVRTAEPRELDISGARWQPFLNGVMNYNALNAKVLARHFDFTKFNHMLDLGGLCEYFMLEAVKSHPGMRVDVVFDEAFVPAVTAAVEAAGLGERVTVAGAPTPDATPAPGHDLVLLAHVLHRFSADENKRILANARAAASDGATLLVLDFVLDGEARQRGLDAHYAGEYLVIDGTVVYPLEDVESWLGATGWELADTVDLPGSPRLIIARAV